MQHTKSSLQEQSKVCFPSLDPSHSFLTAKLSNVANKPRIFKNGKNTNQCH